MNRVRILTHRGQRVVLSDFSGITELSELERAAAEGARIIQSEPTDSVLVLIDLTGVLFGLRVVRTLGEAAAANADFVRARAVVGVAEDAGTTMMEIAAFSRRPLEVFDDTTEALDWLVQQTGE